MRKPDISGATARAWSLLDTARTEPAHAAGIVTYLVTGPFHPLWSWWFVAAIHLRPIPGVPPAHRRYPEAEHEIAIYSLNPDRQPDIDEVDARGDWGDRSVSKFLSPADLVYQCHGLTDEQVGALVAEMVQLMAEGRMSPDSDYRSAWVTWLDRRVVDQVGDARS